MSRLSKLFHNEAGTIFRTTIEYLETVDIPNEQKQAAAVAVAKALHVQAPWDAELEQGVVACIDYVLGELRSWSTEHAVVDSALGTAVPLASTD